MAYAELAGVTSITISTDEGESWHDMTYTFLEWEEDRRPPHRQADIDPTLLVNAQVYMLTDGVQ